MTIEDLANILEQRAADFRVEIFSKQRNGNKEEKQIHNLRIRLSEINKILKIMGRPKQEEA